MKTFISLLAVALLFPKNVASQPVPFELIHEPTAPGMNEAQHREPAIPIGFRGKPPAPEPQQAPASAALADVLKTIPNADDRETVKTLITQSHVLLRPAMIDALSKPSAVAAVLKIPPPFARRQWSC